MSGGRRKYKCPDCKRLYGSPDAFERHECEKQREYDERYQEGKDPLAQIHRAFREACGADPDDTTNTHIHSFEPHLVDPNEPSPN